MKSMKVENAKDSDGSAASSHDFVHVLRDGTWLTIQIQRLILSARSLRSSKRRSAIAVGAVLGAMLFVGLFWARRQGYSLPPVVRPTTGVVSGSSVLSFVAIGDWGRHGQHGQELVAPAMAEWASKVKSPFVVSVGDNFYTDGVNSETDPGFRESYVDVYTQSGLQKPWYVVLGNHDYRGQYLQVQWPNDPAGRWTFPAPSYSVVWDMATGAERAGPRSGVPMSSLSPGPDRSCVAAVYMDTCPLISYYRQGYYKSQTFLDNLNNAVQPAVQLAWVDTALRNASALCDAVVVVGHHPVYSAGEHGDNVDLVAGLKPMLDKYGVDAYIAGHDHTLVHLQKDGVQYVVTGAGSETRDTSVPSAETVFLADKTPGFTIHSANATHMAHTYVDYQGQLLYQALAPLRPKPRA